MEKSKKAANGRWMSVPTFGGWEEEEEDGLPDYSVDFSNLRQARKQNKSVNSRVSVGVEGAALAVSMGDSSRASPAARQHRQNNHFPSVKKKKKKMLLRYFDCFHGS